MISVIRLSGSGLGSGALETCAVVPPEAVLSGEAQETGALHYESKGGKFLIGTWECTPYAETLSYPDTSEFCVVLSGRVALTDLSGKTEEFGAGDYYIVPKGYEGRFEVLETLRKIYVLFND